MGPWCPIREPQVGDQGDWAGRPLPRPSPRGNPTPRPTSSLRAPRHGHGNDRGGLGLGCVLSKGLPPGQPRSTQSSQRTTSSRGKPNQAPHHACTCHPTPAHAPLNPPPHSHRPPGSRKQGPFGLRLGASPCLSRAGEQSQVKCPSRPAGGPRLKPFASSPRVGRARRACDKDVIVLPRLLAWTPVCL